MTRRKKVNEKHVSANSSKELHFQLKEFRKSNTWWSAFKALIVGLSWLIF